MSDALTDSFKMDCERKILEEYVEALIEYLVRPTPQNEQHVCMKIHAYSNQIKSIGIQHELKQELQKLMEDDGKQWKSFSVMAERMYFQQRPDLRIKLLSAAQNRAIGGYQWVV